MAAATSQRRILFGAAIAVAALMLTHALGILGPVERWIGRGLEPIGRFGRSLVIRPDGLPRGSGQSDVVQADLEQRIADLTSENAELRAALTAAIEAAAQSTFMTERRLAGRQARVFARSADPTVHVVAIDAGSDDGVKVGFPVIVRDGLMIGRIQSVETKSSQVLLTIDNRSSLTAVMSDNPAAQGVISGVRGLSLTMRLIPQSEELRIGEIAVTSGTEDGVPPGLVLGEIDRIEKQPGSVLQSASLKPLYRVSQLDAVTVVTGIPR